jgi:ribosomal protein S27E
MWPSSWTCLAAVARTRRLNVMESEPGIAAATLIRALGGVDAVRFLRHRGLIELLYRMAERSGMSWQRRRWAEAHRALLVAGTDPNALESVEVALGRDDPGVAPSGEGRAVASQEFVRTLGKEAAAIRWVTWAERRHLVVRGADVQCPGCGTRSWLPMAALPPPVPCPGCGRQIDQPYGPRGLTFTYRLGEPLRRVLETDSLGHVLTLSWFVELLDRGNLVGAHPGVIFVDPARAGRTLGEADVLLLFADGCLVPIEVKRRAAGVDERTLQLMDTLSNALDAPWDGLVVTEPARDIPSMAAAGRRAPAPDRPRVVLTDDQLHAERVFWSVGNDPFEWNPRTTGEDSERERAFARRLAENDPDRSPDLLRHALLDSSS